MTVRNQGPQSGESCRAESAAPARSSLAGLCCLLLGIGIIVWTVCWVAIERIFAGRLPGWNELAPVKVSALPGAAFVLLYLLIRRGVRWALYAAFVSSSALTVATAISLTLVPQGLASIFTLLLAGAAAVSAFYALASRPQPASQA
jgi:hypothetical protein